MAAAAREHALKRFSADAYVQRVLGVYERAISRSRISDPDLTLELSS
jgi:hypothetical protein